MRKLLVASQKSGVGKTTTSMNLAAAAAAAGARILLLDADPLSTITDSLNLAEHPRRQTLRQMGFDLPGVLISDFVPGLDIFSPYGNGRCTDSELAELLRLITSPPCQEGYGCLIVDTPPFLGAKPSQMLSVCDELMVVMQAESMAYRTLPAFLELVQRSRGEGQDIQIRGILLTLPESEIPGGRWERELRGRFGNRVLAPVIPYDEEVRKAQQAHQIVSAAAPERPAAQAYHALVSSLELAAQRRPKGELAEVPLLAAAAQFSPVGVGASGPSFGLDLPTAPLGEAPPEFEAVAEFQPVDESAWRAEQPVALDPIADDPVVSDKSTVIEHNDLPPTPRLPHAPLHEQLPQPSSSPDPAPLPAVAPSSQLQAERGEKTSTLAPQQRVDEAPSSSWAFLWVGLAMVAGVGLRFIQLPNFMLPLVVGVAVTAGVVLALRLMSIGAGAVRLDGRSSSDERTARRGPVSKSNPPDGTLAVPAPQRETKALGAKRTVNERISPVVLRPTRFRPRREE